MDTRDAYNQWARSYDTVENKTRDLELRAAKSALQDADFSKVIEIGSGTGKNTVWMAPLAESFVAVDFSEEMMNVARQKIDSSDIIFRQADITQAWDFGSATTITCSLVLEHIQDINFIFEQVARSLEPGGRFYLCEIHPFKQLQASRARFEHEGKLVQLEYFIHHISEFHFAALKNGLECIQLQEWFDDENTRLLPRLVSFLFAKKR